jgi:acetyltransferase-like isoleucine patch superfamily enzyme
VLFEILYPQPFQGRASGRDEARRSTGVDREVVVSELIGDDAAFGEVLLDLTSTRYIAARIGRFCILNTLSSLEHRSVMEDFSSLSAGVTTGGFFKLGRYSALGLGVTALDRVSVGENVVIGSGSLLMKDTEDHVLMYGSPARVIRSREPGERFLD